MLQGRLCAVEGDYRRPGCVHIVSSADINLGYELSWYAYRPQRVSDLLDDLAVLAEVFEREFKAEGNGGAGVSARMGGRWYRDFDVVPN